MDILEAIRYRQSIRAFEKKEVSKDIINEILFNASFAPSGGNTQPWKIYVLSPEKMKILEQSVLKQLDEGNTEKTDFNIYPPDMPDRFKDHIKACGLLMYDALAIKKDDFEGRLNQLKKNFSFFEAPVGMIVTVDKLADVNGWGHVGHFIQNICLASLSFGLGTCLQESWSMYPQTVKEHVDFSDDEVLWCGIALGYPDLTNPINKYRTSRKSITDLAKYL